MKNKMWLLQLPLVLLFTFLFEVLEMGSTGDLNNEFLRTKLYPSLQVVTGFFTNFKFKMRGPEKQKNKIVIVEIDSDALAQIGRWPWHRDMTSYLIEKAYESGAKVVGLDVVFSEPDQRVPDELGKLLTENNLNSKIAEFETDYTLEKTIHAHSDSLVLGWATDTWCQPAFTSKETCAITDSERNKTITADFEKFAYTYFITPNGFNQSTTPLISTPDMISNIPIYNQAASHAGFFTAWPDNDGYIRRTNLVMTANGRAYPALPLEMARVGLGEDLEVTLDQSQKIINLGFSKSRRSIPVTPLGAMEVNFRGPAGSFQYVRALELMTNDGDQMLIEQDRKIATVSKMDILKDAYVLIGVSAIGVHDMRAFPFDSNTPGVEGHATILDNLLANDMLTRWKSPWHHTFVFILMTVGAFFFAYATQKLESIPALILFLITICGLTAADVKILFQNQMNWNTGFFYIEISLIFFFTMAVKYVLEEKNKKFIKSAFSKYVAPSIVDSIIKDPSKLTVGGEKRDLSIMFSDIRGFTSFSEKMDAKKLSQFLNDYLGHMTEIVFENEGTLDKYIGDAVMAFWGAPLDQKKHASNACKTAIKMLETLAQHKQRYRDEYDVEVNIGIGINSGAVSVGNMGSERIFEYTVIGDHVNLASRLEGLTKAYGAGIVTSRFTFDEILSSGEPLPPHRVLDFVIVKGKKKSVELIQVLERSYDSQGLSTFEEARKLYQLKKWDEAIIKFQAANELLKPSVEKNDGPSEMYIDRCEEFKKIPPASDWDGSWEMTSK